MPVIAAIKAREILDSRGIPTLEATLWLDNGIRVTTSVPSGTSTGKNEAVELRDGDKNRFLGMGVTRAVSNVNQILFPKVRGLDPSFQSKIDQILVNLDGTANKSNLGANALLVVSQAICKAGAAMFGLPLYEYLFAKYQLASKPFRLPTPIFNVLNGGKHGAGNLDFQEFQIIPSSRHSFSKSLQIGVEIYHTIEEVLIQNNAIHSVGAEGGFAPNLFTNLDAVEILTQAIKQTSYIHGQDVFVGLDAAASHFYQNGKYTIKDRSQPYTATDLIAYYQKLNEEYHTFALEDAIEEEDWTSWKQLTTNLGKTTMIIGDDLIATNKGRLQRAIKEQACNAVIIKPNQIGTITETVEVCKSAHQAGLQLVVSHRSGETTDDFIADFAVGIGAQYLKAGAPARGERVAKYNRVWLIETEIQKTNP